mgnify:FL=1|jgi:cbb3-type cytochrome oxidase subunit 1
MIDYQLVRFYNTRIFGHTYCIFFCFMWWFLLVADLYFLSVGIRSMLEYGADQYNVVMIFCFLFLALIIGLNIYLDRRSRR